MSKPGDKHDQEKPRWDLLPVKAVREIVHVLTFGAAKYSPDGWKKVPDAKRRYYAAALRHLTSWWEGERLDNETGLHHLAHASCCVLFLLAFELGVAQYVEERVDPSAIDLRAVKFVEQSSDHSPSSRPSASPR